MIKFKKIGVILFIFLILLSSTLISYGTTEESRFVYFYSQGCQDCKDISELIEDKNIAANSLELIKNIEVFEDYKEKYKITSIQTPMIIDTQLGEYYVGKSDIQNLLGYKQSVVMGLLDGLNPCAISLLLIVLNILEFKKKKVLLSGISYIAGIFTLNFLAGLGFYHIFFRFKSFFPSWVMLLILLPILIYSIYILFGKELEFIESIRSNLKLKVITNVNKESNKGFLIYFLVGMLVGVLELGCSTQIYIPYTYNLRINEIKNLLIYNLSFVSYLVVILFLYKALGRWLEEKTKDYSDLLEKGTAVLSIAVILYVISRLL